MQDPHHPARLVRVGDEGRRRPGPKHLFQNGADGVVLPDRGKVLAGQKSDGIVLPATALVLGADLGKGNVPGQASALFHHPERAGGLRPLRQGLKGLL